MDYLFVLGLLAYSVYAVYSFTLKVKSGRGFYN